MEVIHVNIGKVPNIHRIWDISDILKADFFSGTWFLKRFPKLLQQFANIYSHIFIDSCRRVAALRVFRQNARQ
jgi:hypothetical protein